MIVALLTKSNRGKNCSAEQEYACAYRRSIVLEGYHKQVPGCPLKSKLYSHSGINSILKGQILYHSGDYGKHTLFLNPSGPSFRVVKQTFSAFFVPAWEYSFFHKSPPPPPEKQVVIPDFYNQLLDGIQVNSLSCNCDWNYFLTEWILVSEGQDSTTLVNDPIYQAHQLSHPSQKIFVRWLRSRICPALCVSTVVLRGLVVCVSTLWLYVGLGEFPCEA